MTTPFTFDFTIDQLAYILPNNQQIDAWYVALADNLPEFDINTPERVAGFLAQIGHESANLTRLRENLNYKATSLIATWPSRFNAGSAGSYANKPEKIANKVYSNRMGNGDESSGDGWLYRGRGPIQITGKENYLVCSMELFGDDRLVQTPELLEQDMDTAIKSACWFWQSKNLNEVADESNIREMTRRINGGYHGESDRTSRFVTALTILQDAQNV